MSKIKNVAIVYPFFAHYRAAINKELNKSKHFHFLFVGDLSGHDGIEVWKPTDEFSFMKTRSMTIFGFLFQSGILRLVLRKDITHYIFLGDAHYITTWIGAALARLAGKRVFFWTHGWGSPDKGLKRLARLAFYRLPHGLLLYGHHARRIGIEAGLRPENLHVIYNSLDYAVQVKARQAVNEKAIETIRASFFEKPMRPMLIFIGRLIPGRRFDLLLEALRHLKHYGFECNLLLVGDGPIRSDVLALAGRDGLSVHAFGACYDESILSTLLMAADLTVVPGRIGLTAMHSLAYGTPVLIHDNPNDQHPEWEAIIANYNGCYFAHNDGHDLARAINDWFKQVPDRAQLRQRCYEVVERFYNPAYQAAQIERALNGEPATDSDWIAFKTALLSL